jgi:predicted dehydrogenase
VACEKGSVSIVRSKVTVREGEEKASKFTEKDFPEEGSGVKAEVKAWAESIADGKANLGQAPEQALADLEILEKMLKSGEAQGKTESLQYQL